MATPRRRRVCRAGAVTALAAVVAVSAGSCAPGPERHRAQYCALMPDSIGLYPGNTVTALGYRIGEVTGVTPSEVDVKVDFVVTEPRKLPLDVKAITRSPSILADRSLELVGNYESGPQLAEGECIPLNRTSTPKSLSEVIGSSTDFINAINPDGSTNVGDVVRGVDEATRNNGGDVNRLLTTSSVVLDSPDQAINDISSIITNLNHLTSVAIELENPLEQTLYDAVETMPEVQTASDAGRRIVEGMAWVVPMVEDIEVNLGEEIQFTLDSTSVALRKLSAHAPRTANLLNPLPWWINTVANHLNERPFNLVRYRPPLYRIRTPDGVLQCNIMNASMPGSCANVQGQPYAVDVALLQYVLNRAATR
jgi:virulence factor Mce-like protein